MENHPNFFTIFRQLAFIHVVVCILCTAPRLSSMFYPLYPPDKDDSIVSRASTSASYFIPNQLPNQNSPISHINSFHFVVRRNLHSLQIFSSSKIYLLHLHTTWTFLFSTPALTCHPGQHFIHNFCICLIFNQKFKKHCRRYFIHTQNACVCV